MSFVAAAKAPLSAWIADAVSGRVRVARAMGPRPVQLIARRPPGILSLIGDIFVLFHFSSLGQPERVGQSCGTWE